MMNDSTMKTMPEFGDKVRFSQMKTTYSTNVFFDEMSLAKTFSYIPGTYKTVDFSDEKKKEIYRKVNKMLGGK